MERVLKIDRYFGQLTERISMGKFMIETAIESEWTWDEHKSNFLNTGFYRTENYCYVYLEPKIKN